jgi:hypothetical protein
MKMANRCHIVLSFPLEAIPEPKERERLYKKYKEDRARTLASNLGAPGNSEEIKNEILVTPDSYMHISRAGNVYSPVSIALDPVWEFKWGFPVWAQTGFAGAKKTCGGVEHGARGYLFWELPVKEVIRNLKYVIKILKNFPISTNLAYWKWVLDDLHDLQEILLWFSTAYELSEKAIATLDWSEVAILTMSEADVRKNNDPNGIMANFKKLSADIRKLKAGKITLRTIERKYAETT